MLHDGGWAHQYMAQPNQPWTNNTSDLGNMRGPKIFTTADTNIATRYGMEPQFPCCTVNHAQGWPKFLSNSWATVNGGLDLVHALLGPSSVFKSLPSAVDAGNKTTVKIDVDTGYPFSNTMTYRIQSSGPLTLHLRVPQWYIPHSSSITVSKTSSPLADQKYDQQAKLDAPEPSLILRDPVTGLHAVSLLAGNSTVVYTLGAEVRTEPRENDAVAVYVGNLLYALDVGAVETSSNAHEFRQPEGPGLADLPFPELKDYFVENTGPWNVAVDTSTLSFVPSTDSSFGFRTGSASGMISVKGCQIEWPLFPNSTPDRVPPKGERTCVEGTVREYQLVPYGRAKMHMSELPTVELAGELEVYE